MVIQEIPFLTVSEFIRAKLKSWVMYALPAGFSFLGDIFYSRGSVRDAQDIVYVINRYWNRVDINRIPEHDMNQFAVCNGAAAPGWTAIKRKYGM